MSIPDIETKILRYLGRWPEGLSTTRMSAWIASCRKEGGYSQAEYEQGLVSLRSKGVINCTNKTWWIKDLPTTMKDTHATRKRHSFKH